MFTCTYRLLHTAVVHLGLQCTHSLVFLSFLLSFPFFFVIFFFLLCYSLFCLFGCLLGDGLFGSCLFVCGQNYQWWDFNL